MNMINVIIRIKIAWALIFSIILFSILAVTVKGHGFEDSTDALLSAASFLYGILIGFAITKSQDKLKTVNDLLKMDEANLLSIYRLSNNFGEESSQHIKKLIDDHLIEQIDYRLIDFEKSGESFQRLHKHVLLLKPENIHLGHTYSQMISLLSQMSRNRKRVETTIHDRVSGFEWASLIALWVLSIALILDLNTNSTFSVIASVTLATVATLLLLVLRDLNTLRWNVQDWIWEPLHNLFLSLDLLPYYAEGVLRYGEAKPPAGSRIRVGHYSKPYPDMTGKTVTEETV